MSPQRPPEPGGDPVRLDAARLRGIEESIAGLAREIHELRRSADTVAGLPDRVDALAGTVTDLATKLAALTARRAVTPCPSWLLAPTDSAGLADLLEGLRGWLEVVFLRYDDADLPECWWWHPDVVEELLWLMHAWLAAYQGPTAAVALVADWHDRQRPGVVRRITKAAGSCSRERHQTRPGWPTPPGAPSVPVVAETPAIVEWWAHHRDRPGPEPASRPPLRGVAR